MTNITKEKKKSAISYVKEYIGDGRLRKDLIKCIKELDYEQPEQDLAKMLLENSVIAVFTRLFFTEGDRYLIEWIESQYNAIHSVDIENMINEYGIMAAQMVENQLFESRSDSVPVKQRQVLVQMNQFHLRLIQEYEKEMEKVYEEKKQRLERDKAKSKW